MILPTNLGVFPVLDARATADGAGAAVCVDVLYDGAVTVAAGRIVSAGMTSGDPSDEIAPDGVVSDDEAASDDEIVLVNAVICGEMTTELGRAGPEVNAGALAELWEDVLHEGSSGGLKSLSV